MDSKERGLAPFKGKKVDRFPMWYGGDPETTQNIMDYLEVDTQEEALYGRIGIDYKTVRPRYTGKPFKKYEDGTCNNEWGIRRGGYYWGQAMNHPLAEIETIADIEKHKFPDPDEWDVKFTDKDLKNTEGYCVIGGSWAPFFHDSMELMGMERFFVEMYMNPELVDAIIEKTFEFYYGVSERMFEANPNIINFHFFGNDFGSQRALLFAPEKWRKFFKPRLAKLIALAHKHGIKAGLHSCGDIHEIFPDFIDIGMDVINPIQVNADNMDPLKLKNEYGKDIVFFGGIDENEILLHASEDKVRAETRRIIDILGNDGKYIVAASHDYLLPQIPACNIVAMFDEAKKYGTGK